jgi:hypothetical protein
MRRLRILALSGLLAAAVLMPARGEGEMKRLSRVNFAKARESVMTQARPLEQALYRLRFESGSTEAVLGALQDYQNSDGGFGKALEPDLRAPESSVLATVRGLQILAAIDTPADHPLVCRAMAYLNACFEESKAVWRIIPPTAGAHPHAPWWSQETLEKTFGEFRINPRAEVLAYLYSFDSSSFPPQRRLTIVQALMQDLESATDPALAGGVEGVARLCESRGLPAEYREALHKKLARLIPEAVEQDPTKWMQYCLKPLWLVRAPDSPFAGLLKDSLERNLDFEIESQSSDGSWMPNWSWFGTFPETWPTAEKEWRGILTVQTLETLQAFGRIEP